MRFGATNLIRSFIFDMPSRQRIAALRKQDEQLLSALESRIAKRTPGRHTREQSYGQWLQLAGSPEGMRALEATLAQRGLFDIRIEQRRVRDLDGESFTMTLARAASTDMWPMGTNYWLRDNAIIGARFLASGNAKRAKVGKAMLISGLSFMSTVSQLKRFQAIIRSQSGKVKKEPSNWPMIFARVRTNLNTATQESWSHKQDAWQILAWQVLSAIDQGTISLEDLSRKHRTFLGRIVPFLCSVDFVTCENSGSWEEIPAVRSSVRAWEHRLIVRLAQLSRRREFSFLAREFEAQRRYLPKPYRKLALEQAVQRMDRAAVKAMIRDLPHESPQYPRSDVRYREGDGSLIYLLLLDYPQFLAERAGKNALWAKAMEEKLLKEILKLVDSASGGIYRYAKDSYQRSGFFRNETAAKLTELFGGPSGDASSGMKARERLVPRGRKAAWTHLVWQLAAWSGEQHLVSGAKRYRSLHDRLFKRGLGFITGKGEVSIDQGIDGNSRIIAIPPFTMPECFIADVGPSGRERIFPSPHTPLNWSVGEMLHATRIRERILEREAFSSSTRRRKAA
jgi:hypothetical protein